MIGMFGSYERMGEVGPFPLGESTVVDVLLHFEAGEAMLSELVWWAEALKDKKAKI